MKLITILLALLLVSSALAAEYNVTILLSEDQELGLKALAQRYNEQSFDGRKDWDVAAVLVKLCSDHIGAAARVQREQLLVRALPALQAAFKVEAERLLADDKLKADEPKETK